MSRKEVRRNDQQRNKDRQVQDQKKENSAGKIPEQKKENSAGKIPEQKQGRRAEQQNTCCGGSDRSSSFSEPVTSSCCGSGPRKEDGLNPNGIDVKRIVREGYARVATSTGGCRGGGLPIQTMSSEDISRSIGYSDEEINAVPEANLGLGCGNPTALANIREGDIVLDLGSGAGFDAFLAAKKLGGTGKVIGVDMTPEMLVKARENARKYGFTNVEFRQGDIEALPLDDGSVDVIISNCVINLAPDKSRVFREAYRVLRPGGRMYVSDIVLLKDISELMRKNATLITCCVGGALLRDDYLAKIEEAGFRVNILGEDTGISKRQYQGIELESLKVEAVKD